MSFGAQTKLGRILRVPDAAERLFAAVPELRDSPYLDLIRSYSLEDFIKPPDPTP